MDAELQLRNRIRETIASVKTDPRAVTDIKKQIQSLKREKMLQSSSNGVTGAKMSQAYLNKLAFNEKFNTEMFKVQLG